MISTVRLFAIEVPPVAPPAGATHVARDTCANFWALSPPADGARRLLVLPAQAPLAWQPADIPGLEADDWTTLLAQRDGSIVIASERRALRFDPRTPQAGVKTEPRAENAMPPPGAWVEVGRMPASNHDIMAAVAGGRIYVAGGITADWGFPARSRAFDELWEIDPKTWRWRTAAKFARPRIFCATVTFGSKIWIVGGDTMEPDGSRHASTLVEIFDPQTGTLTRGPDLPVLMRWPLALVARGRLHALGIPGPEGKDRTAPGRMDSIAPGDTKWRRESDGPPMWALAGAVLDEKLHVCLPNLGLGVFDQAAGGGWQVLGGPTHPRSAQVAAWRGELWIMGGVDIADRTETRIYNPRTRAWRAGPALPQPLAWGAAAVIDDRIVVIGGAGRLGDQGRYNYSDRVYRLSDEAAAAHVPAGGVDAATVTVSSLRAGLETLPPWTTSQLAGTGGGSLPVTTEVAFPRLELRRLVWVDSVPAAAPSAPERLVAIESDGPISTFPNRRDVSARDVLLDLPARFRGPIRTNGLAFHPKYPGVPYLYVHYNRVQPKPALNCVSRFTLAPGDPPRADPASESVLLTWPGGGHEGGDLKFGPDGFLYISSGDGGAPGDLKNVGQRVDIITGGILRIDVDRAAGGKNYAVPPDNPFVGMPNVLPEYWAYGLRNPWRMNFDPKTGDLWAGDNGDDSWESVQLIRKGHNYGWSVFEGSHPFRPDRRLAGPNPRATPPVVELSHAEARSVIGGLFYRGKALPGLAEQAIFGDFVTGYLWAFRWDGSRAVDLRRIADTRVQPTGFGEERSGEVLMASLDGGIRRLVAAPPPEARRPPPSRLSETGLFTATKTHTPAAGVLPFEINAPMWSDGASAQRLLAVPPGQKIGFSPNQEWTLPEGSAVARTLELPASGGPRRIETQVMHVDAGIWQYYTYAWNAAQTDAELVPEAGETREVPAFGDRRWKFASRAECATCHNAQTSVVLGLKASQLNRNFDYRSLGGGVGNQVRTLMQLDLLRNPPRPLVKLSHCPDPHDAAAPLEARARTYLDVNCAHCHRAGGVGGRATFAVRDILGLGETGLVDGRPIVPLLGADARLVEPGNPAGSELFHRMNLAEGGRMPLLGAQLRDEAGVELIRQWIENLAAPR